ncbi:protein DOUBLE-STRAND BREAK FORMATION [Typha latifolia]|uniref:protein DOUBLE-STRAND BREAK FORMATION n=1 Tax=Typha latifolia TaxID=4733 RepID=UPI003C2D0062
MAEAMAERVALFASQVQNRRFSTATLQILEAILVTKDVPSLLETRSALSELLRSQAMAALGEISEKAADHKLYIVEFFVRAFALVGDVESCLVLKYEALVLRESKYLKDHDLEVAYEEWITFAKDSLDNGFYTIAAKGFENAMLCIQSNINVDSGTAADHTINKIKGPRDMATRLIASHSVQTESAQYLQRKATRVYQNCSLSSVNRKCVASSMFRYGIRKRNIQKLYHSRGLNRDVGGPYN